MRICGKKFGGAGILLGLLLGLGWLSLGDDVFAQDFYAGDQSCAACHSDKYNAYKQHGHAWMEIPTGGQAPGPDLFGLASVGITSLPDPATVTGPDGNPLTWAGVAAIFGAFKESGAGDFVRTDGRRAGSTAAGSDYTTRCFKCHNPTGWTATGTMYGLSSTQWTHGAPANGPNGKPLQGVQCEACHGPGGMFQAPTCNMDCHSRTDLAGDPNLRIPYAPTENGKTGVFTNHHAQGDETRRSPHKNIGCPACHSEHKSVWHEKGGVRFAPDPTDHRSVGAMCKGCHVDTNPNYPDAPKMRVRGTMGELLVCVDCHMPEKSDGVAIDGVATSTTGSRATHIFKINPDAKVSSDPSNYTVDGTTKYWNSTDLNGDSYLTLDMVCGNCHTTMEFSQMQIAAEGIHRQPGVVDLTVNGSDSLLMAKSTDQASADVSIQAGAQAGMSASWWAVAYTPWGWYSWDLTTWKPGFFASLPNYGLVDVPSANLLKSPLPAGMYTFWFGVFPTDGSQNIDGVPVFVTP